jgi:hypothetical protein
MLKRSLLGGCPLIDVKRTSFKDMPSDAGAQKACLDWSRQVSDRITAEAPDIVFVSSFAAAEPVDDGTGRSQLDQYRDGFAQRIIPWAANGSDVYVLRDTPLTLGRTTPDCLSKNLDTPRDCSVDRGEALPVDPLAEAALAAESARIRVLDLSDQFCPDGRCYASIGGAHVYYDDDHVTSTYMRSLIPALAESFNASRG